MLAFVCWVVIGEGGRGNLCVCVWGGLAGVSPIYDGGEGSLQLDTMDEEQQADRRSVY